MYIDDAVVFFFAANDMIMKSTLRSEFGMNVIQFLFDADFETAQN
jgi:hypothetical protein